jgi:sporulation protein YlmC with PRC-barrel domain
MVFAKSLAKKMVLLSDGTVVGTLYNITVDLKTGAILELIIKPAQNPVPELEKQNDLYIVPFESVKSISDYIVLDKRKILRRA